MRKLGNLFVIVCAMFISGGAHAVCVMGMGSSCPPNESVGKERLGNELSRVVMPPFKVEKFEKTDGKSMNFMGMEAYSMFFVATVSSQGDLRCRDPLCAGLREKFNFSYDDRTKLVTIRGELVWEKTEKGWR